MASSSKMIRAAAAVAVAWLTIPTLASPITSPGQKQSPRDANPVSSLSELALQKVLNEAAPVFGYYENVNSQKANWMKAYPDDTLIVHMNIPGAHDVQTWNYTETVEDELLGITALGDEVPEPAEIYQCQERPIIDMLNDGLRAFDLRYAFDVTNSTLVYWHSGALISQTATVEDTMYGFYQWLDDHPSEALLVSFQYEGSTTAYATNNADVQLALFNILTSEAANKYILQTKNSFGTLGEARGKITLLRRFDLDLLDASYMYALPGVHFSPNNWTDDDPAITLVYNTDTNGTAHIEDYYGIETAANATADVSIRYKYNATTANILKAASNVYHNDLFWSFASSENEANVPVDTPRIMALGNGTDTPLGGVNQQLIPFFQGLKGQRLGIVMFDFYNSPSDLIDVFLSV